jgi:hypothetical protein
MTTDTGTCKSCGAKLLWVVNASGRRNPLDRDPSPAGNVRLLPDGTCRVVPKADLEAATAAGEELRTSHFATCPGAASFRRR